MEIIHTAQKKNGLISFCSETKALSNASGWTEEVELGDISNVGSAPMNVLDLRSETKKFLVNMPDNFYHYFADLTTLILAVHSVEPDTEIIVDESFFYATDENTSDSVPSYYRFVYEMLDNLKIKYRTIKARDVKIVIDNFILPNDIRFFDKFLECAGFLKNYIEEYIVDTSVEPYRKVYLSRQSGPETTGRRIDNEKYLTEHFISMGFEPTDASHFDNVNDQIKFFYETKIVCGLTGSGLANILFMKDFQTVIELVSLIEFPGPNDTEPVKREIHDFYKMIAFDKKHTLINIPNANGKHEDLTRLIDKQIAMLRNIVND